MIFIDDYKTVRVQTSKIQQLQSNLLWKLKIKNYQRALTFEYEVKPF